MELVNADRYSLISKYTTPVKDMDRAVLGRDKELKIMKASLSRKELCNVLLLAPAGSGKTALVQQMKKEFKDVCFRELNLSLISADYPDGGAFGNCLKDIFNEIAEYVKNEGTKVILFIDEFHQIVQLSPSGVEAMKPILADSGTRGIRIIAATTYNEFIQYISPNQPLVERLQRINLQPTDDKTTVAILRDMARTYGVSGQIQPKLYREIVDYTNRYIPSNAQPRKSLLILDAMCGWNSAFRVPFDHELLREVIEDQEGVRVDIAVDPTKIKSYIDKYVIAQGLATTTIEQYLQIAVAGLSDKTRPLCSFLFCGSTGVGKTEVVKRMSEILFGKHNDQLIRFDMTEFANPDSLNRFRIDLTRQVWTHPHCIILLDEIEKACSPVTRLLLQVLDDGRLVDENDRVVVFTNAYIVMTTNASSEIYDIIGQYSKSDTGDGSSMQRFMNLIKRSIRDNTGDNRFPPELLGRIDAIVPFQPLSPNTQRTIVTMKLESMKKKIKNTYAVDVKITDDIIDYLVDDMAADSGDTKGGGARNLNSTINTAILAPIARVINENHGRLRRISVSYVGNMASKDKHALRSEGYIKVVRDDVRHSAN